MLMLEHILDSSHIDALSEVRCRSCISDACMHQRCAVPILRTSDALYLPAELPSCRLQLDVKRVKGMILSGHSAAGYRPPPGQQVGTGTI